MPTETASTNAGLRRATLPTQRGGPPALTEGGCRSAFPPPAVGLRLPLPGVDLVLSFAVLAEELHYTKAARRLFLSQSGLSRRIAHLEELVGAALVDRSERQLRLTPAGCAVLQFADSLLEAAALLEARLRGPLGATGIPDATPDQDR